MAEDQGNYKLFYVPKEYHGKFDRMLRTMKTRARQWAFDGIEQEDFYDKGEYTIHPLTIKGVQASLIRSPINNLVRIKIENAGIFNRRTRAAKSKLVRALEVPILKEAA